MDRNGKECQHCKRVRVDDDDDELRYTVEIIMNKRAVVGNQIQYLVKWIGHGEEGTTWESESDLISEIPARCEIKKFNRLNEAREQKMQRRRKRRATTVVDRNEKEKVFAKPDLPAKKAKSKNSSTSSSAIEIARSLPELKVVAEKLVGKGHVAMKHNFYEHDIDKMRHECSSEFESERTPENIVGATEADGETLFMMKWKDDRTELVPIRMAKVMYPQLVIEFFQDHITWVDKR